MKNQFVIIPIVVALLSVEACSERVVVERPAPPPVVVRPAAPHGRPVYVEYEYRWKQGKYVAVPGYYIKEKKGRTWIPGKWEKKNNGYMWIKGHWK